MILYLSHPARGAWIEMPSVARPVAASKSHPARGAWIEIFGDLHGWRSRRVAPRKGCVD